MRGRDRVEIRVRVRLRARAGVRARIRLIITHPRRKIARHNKIAESVRLQESCVCLRI